jgi:hypothetical protein
MTSDLNGAPMPILKLKYYVKVFCKIISAGKQLIRYDLGAIGGVAVSGQASASKQSDVISLPFEGNRINRTGAKYCKSSGFRSWLPIVISKANMLLPLSSCCCVSIVSRLGLTLRPVPCSHSLAGSSFPYQNQFLHISLDQDHLLQTALVVDI